MPQVQILRAFVQQRLTAAAEEIFELFERTIAEYEETLCRQGKLLDAVFKPQVRLQRTDVQLVSVSKEDVAPELQERKPCLDQDDTPELPHIKAEEEELWTSQEGEHLHKLEEADVSKLTFTPVPVKSEEDERKHRTLQLHHTKESKYCGEPEPDESFKTESYLKLFTDDETPNSSAPETDDNCDWEETRGSPSGLNYLRNIEEPEGDIGKTQVPSFECAPSFVHEKHRHEDSGIQKGVKPFSCSVCGTKFTYRARFLTHLRIHTGEKPFNCSVCGTRFSQKGTLKYHMRTHTGEKPFSCTLCSKRFGQNGTMRRHMRTHTGEKPFSCSVCDKRFGRLAHLKRHSSVCEQIRMKLQRCSFS